MDLYGMAGHLIRRLNQISVSIFAERMRGEGLDLTPVQFGALAVLEAHPGIDQATLAGLIAYDRVTIGGVVDRLQARGLVAREISPRDRRARVIRLTPAGQALVERAAPAVRDLQGDILAGLDAAERREFLRLLEKAADAGNARSRAPLLRPETGRTAGDAAGDADEGAAAPRAAGDCGDCGG